MICPSAAVVGSQIVVLWHPAIAVAENTDITPNVRNLR
jgi:hypothetical protein